MGKNLFPLKILVFIDSNYVILLKKYQQLINEYYMFSIICLTFAN
jgi:hypothetical protein